MRVFCLPAVRSREGQGSPPWVRTADAPAIHAMTAPPQRIRPVDCVRSRGCGIRRTADADAWKRPGSPHAVRSTRVGTAGDGLLRWLDGRTARTTAACRGGPCGCPASVCHKTARPRDARSALASPSCSAQRQFTRRPRGTVRHRVRTVVKLRWGISGRTMVWWVECTERESGLRCGYRTANEVRPL